MAVNEPQRQVQIAVELEETARSLAHSTREVPNPADSYRLLAELGRATDHLQQTVRQLSAWHRRVVDGQEYRGEDENGDGVTGTLEAAEQLEAAADALDHASDAIRAAHAANGVVRWVGE
ncbi:hypothetical protein [Amnibacterium endophyticum]|uniref:Uncharacterized protein n=1 Tax=Amnibacterium endophyticum TaxID=2109337 RepID=A0ABW4LGP4_9MICO